MAHRSSYLITILSVALAAGSLAAQDSTTTTPDSHLGFQLGADRQLADWDQIVSYFAGIAETSGRVELVELGRSPEGRPIIATYISSAENIANMEEILARQRELTFSPETENEAQRWAQHKLPVLISCSIHSTEIGASQMSMGLLYRLATSEEPEVQLMRDRLVVILIPSPNPDGIQMVVEWYRRWPGTEYEGCRPPLLYERYAGHDNNRDWYALNLPESRVLASWLWTRWFPPVTWDAHQMGGSSLRAFVPPFIDPPNDVIHPLVIEGISNVGHAMKAAALRAGHRGVGHGTWFSLWWNGGFRTTANYKNSLGILSELASCRLATPIEVSPEELDERGVLDKTVSNPAPWMGGRWSLGDIISLEYALADGLLTYCARNHDHLIADYRRACLDGITAADGGSAAFLVPRDQHDAGALARFIEIMDGHGISPMELAAEIRIEDRLYPAGTLLYSALHPHRPFIRSMFERFLYPEQPPRPDGSPADPYDVSGWTLADQMGIETQAVSLDQWRQLKLADSMRRPSAAEPELLTLSSGVTLYRAADIDSFKSAAVILAGGGYVTREYPQENYEDQALYFAHYDPNRDVSGFDISGRIEEAARRSLALPRLAMLRGYLGSMDEGWTRLLLERFAFPFQSLDCAAVKAGNLRAQFDAIILPNIGERSLLGGNGEDYPPEFRGGFGEEGFAQLQAFVQQGGTLICLANVGRTIIERFELPVIDLLKDVDREEFSIPGSLVRLEPDTSHPLAFGMQPRAAAMFRYSLALEPAEGAGEQVEVVARYAPTDLLVSGFERGGEHLAGKAAAVVVSHGEGKIVLIGFPCQYRAQPYSTLKLLLNAVLYAGDRTKAAPEAAH